MAVSSRPKDVTFAAGFEFARRLKDPDFRTMLQSLGWQHGQHVVMAVDEEPVIDILTRVMFHETGGRAFIAIVGGDPSGFRFLSVEVVPAEAEHTAPLLKLGPAACIGMLYSALAPCGEYVPSEWMRPVLFERVAVPA